MRTAVWDQIKRVPAYTGRHSVGDAFIDPSTKAVTNPRTKGAQKAAATSGNIKGTSTAG